MAEQSMDLPEECWELVFNFMEHRHQLSSLSLVSKTFLSITNDLVRTLTVSDPTALVLPDLLRRFSRLKAIDLSGFHGETDGLLSQIANSGLDIESLNVSKRMTLPIRGLRAFASKVKSLKALNCSEIGSLRDDDLNSIAQAFPCLEELDISYPEKCRFSDTSSEFVNPITDAGIFSLSERLKSLRKINLSGNNFITDKSLDFLSMNCLLLSEIVLYSCYFLTQNGVASLIHRCANLNSVSACRINFSVVDSTFSDALLSAKALCVVDFRDSIISNELLFVMAKTFLTLTKVILANCRGFTFDGISFLLSKHHSVQHLDLQAAKLLCDEDMHELWRFLRGLTYVDLSFCTALTASTFFGLTRNCPLLREIKMVHTNLGAKDCAFSAGLIADHTRIERLNLANNPSLHDECLRKITSFCPNLQNLDLSHCSGITERGILEALKTCPQIRYLGMNRCTSIKNFMLDFELSKLEVLSASQVKLDDYALGLIGSKCPRLLQLDLSYCFSITEKGVEEIVQKCRALREISLKCSNNVNIDIVSRLVFSRPSLRKIVPPRGFVPSESWRNFYLRHGCLVCDG